MDSKDSKKVALNDSIDQINIMVMNVGYAETQHHWGGLDFSSPFARLYYVKKGKARLYMKDREVEAHPGYMYLVPTFVPHRYECEPGTGFYYMFVFEHNLSGTFDRFDFPTEVKANEAVDLLFTNYCTLYPELSLPYSSAEDFERHPAYREYAMRYTQMERYAKMQLQGLAFIITSYFVKQSSLRVEQSDKRLQRVADYVKEHIAEAINLDKVADIACVTKMHLIRMFRKKMGITPLQYIIRKKIQHTQGLLLTTNLSVGRIGESIGMYDTSYFIRLFKKHIGFTPQSYRDALR